MFSMRYLGDENGPAPRLNDVHLEDDLEFLNCVLSGIKSLAEAGVVHADLSAYNILVFDCKPWFIDFSEAIRVDRTGSVPWVRLEEARTALERAMRALGTYFTDFETHADSSRFISEILASLDRFGVLK
jgi:RIO kinase 1